MHKPRLCLKARLDRYTGYGQHATRVISDFTKFGYNVNVKAISVDTYHGPLPEVVIPHLVGKEQEDDWELLLYPPNIAPATNKFVAYFTMWETTRLSKEAFGHIKKADAVIVPSAWGANCFSAQGIDCPIFICPLGVDPTIYQYRESASPNCVFGSAGNTVVSGRSRKGINDVIDAFQFAFPDEEDVTLKIKTLPGKDAVKETDDSRIVTSSSFLSEEALVAWYQSLDCFVSGSRAEGWGFMQQQAMACGKPVIASAYGGLCEFFDQTVGYPVRYSIVPAQGRYEGLGCWCEPDLYHMADQMRRVYEDRNEARRLGLLSRARSLEYTWEHSNRRLEAILKELGAFE